MKNIICGALALLVLNAAHAELRVWTLTDGRTMEAEYFTTIGDQAVFNANGKQHKVPLTALSKEDLKYIDLAEPPALNVTFTKKSSQLVLVVAPNDTPPDILEFSFGAKVKQTSAKAYTYPLTVEYFAIGAEISGNKYILLDRQSKSFSLTKENDRSFEFLSEKKVRIIQYDNFKDQNWGRKVVGNLVIVTDERGVVIGYNSSPEWLYDKIENLKQLPVGAYFDKSCIRCYPTPPKVPY